MKIAIINDIHIGQPLLHQDHQRAASHLVQTTLPQVLDHIEHRHAPDVMIHLGDLIRSEGVEEDEKNYRSGVNLFKRVKCPVIHVIGNHEIKKLSPEHLEHIWREAGFDQNSHGLLEIGGFSLIWLGMDLRSNHAFQHYLPSDQLTWLKETLQQNRRPTIIFSHCAIDDQNVEGNFFYERHTTKNHQGFFLENSDEIQKVLSKSPHVEMVVQAHLHYFHSKVIDQIPHVTCPAMGDNICGPTISEHVPEVYSLLTIDKHLLTLKAFSRDYCFAGCEFERRKNRSSINVE